MRQTAVLAMLIATLGASSAPPSHARTNFSGTWVLDTTVLGRQTGPLELTIIVTQTDSSIAIRRKMTAEMGVTDQTITALLDGRQTTAKTANGATLTTSIAWSDSTMIVTSHGKSAARAWDDVQHWSLGNPKLLSIGQTVTFDGKKVREEGAVFRRQE